MRVILQRSLEAKVEINQKMVGKIDRGLVILVGFTDGDNSLIIDKMIEKIVNLRIFDDDSGIMNRSILDIKGEVLSVSQFTLYANTSKGRRPSYVEALNPKEATVLYDEFNQKLSSFVKVETGIFGSDMQVSLINDGPVTISLEF